MKRLRLVKKVDTLATSTGKFRSLQHEMIQTLMSKLKCSEREAKQVLVQLLEVPSESSP